MEYSDDGFIKGRMIITRNMDTNIKVHCLYIMIRFSASAVISCWAKCAETHIVQCKIAVRGRQSNLHTLKIAQTQFFGQHTFVDAPGICSRLAVVRVSILINFVISILKKFPFISLAHLRVAKT